MPTLPATTGTDGVAAPRSRLAVHAAIAILTFHALLVGWVSYVTGPNLDEPAHLASGISHWMFGQFELYRVNPPLVRLVASAPVLATSVETDWSSWRSHSNYSRPEFYVGRDFALKNKMAGFWYFTMARWACLPLCLIGAWVTFLWARDLYGDQAGVLAIWLYCFCPNLIGWGASITPDAVGASLGILAAYKFWRWLQRPDWNSAMLAGLCLGLAELAKATWIILFVVFPIIWFAYWITRREWRGRDSADGPSSAPHAPSPPARQLVVILGLALYLLNLGFGFERTLKPLGEFTFISQALSGQKLPPKGANRFEGGWFARLPVPLPENYVKGLDVQKHDFERGGWSFLWGEHKFRGWWYYYLAAFGFKSPIGTLVIFALATGLGLACRSYRAGWRSELALLLPAIVVMTLVSSQTGFNRYLRYALPFLPFACIHASRCALALVHGNRGLSVLIVAAAGATAAESLSVYPHSMSFFNGFTGGPLRGHVYLLDSNIDWAQDMLYLKKWYDANPDARPFYLERFGSLVASPEAADITSAPVPGYLPPALRSNEFEDLPGPQPGWFALSINHVKGYRFYLSDRPKFAYFQRLQPIARAGYSIYIYHLTRDDANALRLELGLDPLPPELPPPVSPPTVPPR